MTMSRGAPDAMACTGYDWDIPTPRLDDRRRVACKGADELDYRFRCGMLRMSLSEAAVLREDCSMVFPLNTSNWLAATASMRVEQQVRDAVFDVLSPRSSLVTHAQAIENTITRAVNSKLQKARALRHDAGSPPWHCSRLRASRCWIK
jgi:hypothetical protein